MIAIPNRVRVVALIWALALAGGLLTLVLLAKSSQAQSNGAVTTKMPIAGNIDASACQGEFIAIEGTIHTVNHSTDLGDGRFHVNSHLTIRAKGVGLDPETDAPNGNKYVLTSTGTSVETLVASGQFQSKSQDINMVIGKGQLPNQVALARIQFIVSSEGVVKLENFHFIFECHPPTTASPTATAGPTATGSPGTGGAALAVGAGFLLVGAGLAARRTF